MGSAYFIALFVGIPPAQVDGLARYFETASNAGPVCFFYGCVHLATFAHFYIGWTLAALVEELAERSYITMGFAAWLLMLPLALTSTRAIQRRLRKNWQRLHRFIYPAAILVCLHILWQARSDIGDALVYIALFGWMLVWRYFRHRRTG